MADPTLRERLLADHDAIPTSAVRRLWRTGRSALGVGAALLRSRRGDELDLTLLEGVVHELGGLKGVAMKVGQMLGYLDAGMPPELRQMMSTLQTAAPSAPLEEVHEVLREALGERAQELIDTLEPAPLAVASIGQVHRACLPDGTQVIVKVRHRGIEAALRADFRSASLGKVFAAIAGTPAIRDIIEEARTAFLEECDFELEASRQQRFGEIFADDPDVVIPAIEPAWCGPGVLVARFVGGRSLAEFLAAAPAQAERDRIGGALFRFWVRTLYREGLFHADPHPGNFAILDDGRVVLYDFGCVRQFDRPLLQGFARLGEATRRDDPAAMSAAIAGLGGVPPGDDAGREHLRQLLRGFFGPLLHEGARAIAADEGFEARTIMRDKLAVGRLQLPGRTLFLFRLRFGLYAVLAQLGAVLDWSALERSWARALVA